MRIFILEDDTEYRTPTFRSKLVGHELVFAETAQEAINILESNEKDPQASDFDLIFLDHDLGGLQMVGTERPNTGSEVVRYMVRMNKEDGWTWPTTVIHSLNTPAAIAMQHDLESVGVDAHYIPFTQLVNHLDEPGFLSQ